MSAVILGAVMVGVAMLRVVQGVGRVKTMCWVLMWHGLGYSVLGVTVPMDVVPDLAVSRLVAVGVAVPDATVQYVAVPGVLCCMKLCYLCRVLLVPRVVLVVGLSVAVPSSLSRVWLCWVLLCLAH